jgi:alanine racemase
MMASASSPKRGTRKRGPVARERSHAAEIREAHARGARAGTWAMEGSGPRPGRPAWAEIDLDAIRDNVRALMSILSPPTRFMAVVKADAYGHGAAEVARAAVGAGAWGLGVATTDEGVQLRRAGITAPILLLGPTPPEEASRVVEHDLAAAVFQAEVAGALSDAAGKAGRRARIHLKIDTGMGRIGMAPRDAVALARSVCALPRIVVEGCFTHLATADEVDLGPAQAQLASFRAVLDELDRAGIATGMRHAANSAAALALPESHLDLVRCGIAVYGVTPAPHLKGRVRLRPAMRLRARVVHTKRVDAGTPIGYGHAYRVPRATTIVTVPVGYADGYPRLAGRGGHVVISGRRHPIAGRISMDQLTVDAGGMPVQVGGVVELWGDALPVEEVADLAQTISYEVLARVSPRVPRVFMEGGRVRAVRTLLGGGG